MFYSEDLQSGIAQAMSQSKMVACFVTGMRYTYPNVDI
jgi:hypothetical protein